MTKCMHCGHQHSVLYRCKLNMDNVTFLPCKQCGAELVSREKLLLLLIFELIVMVCSMFFVEGALEYFVATVVIVVIVLSFYLFIPIKKENR